MTKLLTTTCLIVSMSTVCHGQDFEEIKLAAERGDALAQAHMGVAYAIGAGVTKNSADAAEWFRLSAEQGNADAQVALTLKNLFGMA